MRKIMLAFAVSALPLCAALADEELPGTYKLTVVREQSSKPVRSRMHTIAAGAKTRCVVRLEPFRGLSAEGQSVRVGCREGDVFEVVERFSRNAGIGENSPVLLPPIEENCGSFRNLVRVRAIGICARVCGRKTQRRSHQA
jgi:hypothetical protein